MLRGITIKHGWGLLSQQLQGEHKITLTDFHQFALTRRSATILFYGKPFSQVSQSRECGFQNRTVVNNRNVSLQALDFGSTAQKHNFIQDLRVLKEILEIVLYSGLQLCLGGLGKRLFKLRPNLGTADTVKFGIFVLPILLLQNQNFCFLHQILFAYPGRPRNQS